MSSNEKEAPLPDGWSRGWSKSQKRTYYYHAATKVTQWHFPTRTEAAQPGLAKLRADINTEQERKRRSGEGLGFVAGNISAAAIQSSAKPAKRPRTAATSTSAALADTTSVAIIVPYRDLHPAQKRASHLKQFVPHMNKFLGRLLKTGKLSAYHIYIVEQSDDGRKFNRGKLLNIGFDLARKSPKKHDVYIFHDVDLLPQDDLAQWYCKFPQRPIHIARVWGRYSNNPKYFGGVVSFSAADLKKINSYPNTFWGWGGEDDEMQKRLEACKIKWIWPPSGTLVDLEDMTIGEKLQFLRENKAWKCMSKWEALAEHEKTWKTNGLADLKYEVLENQFMDPTKNASKINVDVKLNGNHWSNEQSGVDYLPPRNH